MNPVPNLLRAAASLFFDDSHLAIVVVLILGATALLMNDPEFDGPPAIALLVGGVAFALVENVVRTARRAPRN